MNAGSGKISAQPHTLIMYATFSYYRYAKTAIMKRTSQSENCMHNQCRGLCGNLALVRAADTIQIDFAVCC